MSATPGFEADVVRLVDVLARGDRRSRTQGQAFALASAYLELKRVRQEKRRLLDACTERLGDEIDPKGSAFNVLDVIDEFRRLENYERRWRTQVKKSAVRLKYVGVS